ncbi:MAG: radical SAM family heme chaperone HemW [Phycisphaeraceae bacterium]|nr:radical SAM family heme chaperone HemW [Phycisphaerales bacterium]MCB9860260.1 radical SAM family heme chaperone HemW [Phycisphaeraceae bacterium]
MRHILPAWDDSGPDQPRPNVRSIYIHIPFCFHKCHYCDFYSIVDNRDRQQIFTDRLTQELNALSTLHECHNASPTIGSLRTLFVGGGTPTLLKPELWEQLLHAINTTFDLHQISDNSGEFTVEANPETVTRELMDVLRAGGVNRISVGAQSFNENHLKTLERWHDPANVSKAVRLARDAGLTRQSADLIFAIPGQTLADWRDDLSQAIDLGVDHISCYNLTYEPNTAMTQRLHKGDFTPTDESLEVEMQLLAVEMLATAGLERYEVSNFARPGQECAHNLAYWRNENWLAAGPSAAGHIDGFRYKNAPRLDTYLSHNDNGFAPVQEYELPDPSRTLSDVLLGALRLREGIATNRVQYYANLVDEDCFARVQHAAEACADSGWLQLAKDRWTIHNEGWLFVDRVVREMIQAIHVA